MKFIDYTNQFKRDAKKAQKRGKDINKLLSVIQLLADNQPLSVTLKDHPLKGEWQPSRELHLEPDWLFVYSVDDERVLCERTGTHSDLFG